MAVTMIRALRSSIVRLSAAAILTAFGAAHAQTRQPPPPRVVTRDSVTLAAGARYEAGGFSRFFLGNTYRDLWTTPIRVPVLDLHTYAGGLRAQPADTAVQARRAALERRAALR